MSSTATEGRVKVDPRLVEGMAPPCELGERGPLDCGPARASWVLFLCCPLCGATGIRLACERCKDQRMTADEGYSVHCAKCDDYIMPPRHAYVRIEKL